MLSRPIRRAAFASAMLALVAALLLAVAPAAADTQTVTVTQQVTCQGGQTDIGIVVYQAPVDLQFSTAAQSTSAALLLEAGMRGGCAHDGWKVTLMASDLVATGIGTINASNVRAVSLRAITRVNGQPQLPLPGTVGNTPLNTPVMVMQALPNTGNGVYLESIGLALMIPGSSAPGTYSTTLTTTISVGPI